MKKIFAIILAILTMFIFTACSSGSDNCEGKSTYICYEIEYILRDHDGYWDLRADIDGRDVSKYEWGDTFDGDMVSDRYAKFILKDDYTAEVWWQNEKHSGRWKKIEDEIKVLFNNDRESVSIVSNMEKRGCIIRRVYYIRLTSDVHIYLTKTKENI